MTTMSLQQNYETQMAFNAEVKEFIDQEFKYLGEDQVDNIISYINKKNYLQILYTWGPELIQSLLKHFKSVENYTQCILIRDTINNHNKATGEQLKLEP